VTKRLGQWAVCRRDTVIFGDRVFGRSFGGGAAQLLVRCAALNRMTQLGMPDSYKG
jgi:hypothetical protein